MKKLQILFKTKNLRKAITSAYAQFLKRELRTRYAIKTNNKGKLPRLSVFRSNKNISAQLIDDSKGVTLLSVTSSAKSFESTKSKVETARLVGKLIAQKAKKMKIDAAVFDKGGYKYHGRVAALADAAREAGLKI